MNATQNTKQTAHTPTPWHTGAGPSKYVFIPGNAKPINAGSIERAALIVRDVNAHDDLVAALNTCLKAERERRAKLKPGAPATTYTDERIVKIEAALAMAGAA